MRGGRWTPEAEVGEWGGLESSHSPPGREARQGRGSRRPQRAGAAPWESTVEGKTLSRGLAASLFASHPASN